MPQFTRELSDGQQVVVEITRLAEPAGHHELFFRLRAWLPGDSPDAFPEKRFTVNKSALASGAERIEALYTRFTDDALLRMQNWLREKALLDAVPVEE